jgi:DNA uptake protein ComE-like DNA-binding protein
VTGDEPNRRVTRVDGSYLVYSQGQDRDPKTCGSVAFMTRRLTGLKVVKDASTGFPFMVTDSERDQEAQALETTPETGGLRILGSGIMNCFTGWTADSGLHFDAGDFPTRNTDGAEVAAANSPAKSQAGTIPREGPAGGGGLNLNIPNIWRANRHFGKGLVSINTASLRELQDAGLPELAAKWIVATRRRTDRGYSWDEYLEKLRAIERMSMTQRAQLELQGLDTSSLVNPERFKF